MFCIKDQAQYKDLVSRLTENGYGAIHTEPERYPCVATVTTESSCKLHKVKWLNTERIVEVAEWIKQNANS